jgi:pimeloyl-ACP methyl ester carboxylesterase
VSFLDALGQKGPVLVAGHDIGGGVAQHLMLSSTTEVPRVAVVNGIMYDSWPVPGVAASGIRPWLPPRRGTMFWPRVAYPL